MLAFLLPLLKHEGFSSEQEYRIVQVRADHDGTGHGTDVDSHAGQSSLVPHVGIPLPMPDYAIVRIVVGPCPDPEWAARAEKMPLERHDIGVPPEVRQDRC